MKSHFKLAFTAEFVPYIQVMLCNVGGERFGVRKQNGMEMS